MTATISVCDRIKVYIFVLIKLFFLVPDEVDFELNFLVEGWKAVFVLL